MRIDVSARGQPILAEWMSIQRTNVSVQKGLHMLQPKSFLRFLYKGQNTTVYHLEGGE